MRRFAVAGVAVFIGVLVFAPSGLAANARIAALQIGLRAHGFDPGPVDGVAGPDDPTRDARLPAPEGSEVRRDTSAARRRRALGRRGRPLLGQRELGVGSVGWDVAVLEFRLRRYGLGPAPSTEGSRAARGVALRRYQSRARTRRGRHRRPEDVPLARRPDRDPRDPRLHEVACRPRRERASSRSRRATTSARGGSRGGTGCR